MTLDGRKLPLEVWMNIFYFLPLYEHIAECRLVCKTWDAPAEKTMFKIGLSLGITRQMKRLCYHLTQKPALANAINGVSVPSLTERIDMPLLKKLLRLILHPNISRIRGYQCSTTIIAVVYEILQKSKLQFHRLAQLPTPRHYDTIYSKLIYTHRDTLEHVEIEHTRPMDHIFTHLNEFTNLIHIKIKKTNILNLQDLDDILQRIPPSCKSMDFHLDCAERFSSDRGEGAMTSWLSRHVVKVDTVKKLKITSESDKGYDIMMEYLTYKYTNLDSITADQWVLQSDKFQRIAQQLSQISNVNLYSPFYEGSDVPLDIVRIFKARNNGLSINYELPYGNSGLSIRRDLKKGNSDLLIQLDCITTNAAYMKLLSCLGSSRVQSLVVDLLCNKYKYPNYRTITEPTFLDIVSTVPQVEVFEFAETRIPKLEPCLVKLEKLKKLKFSGAKIDSAVLPAISKMTPHLEHLVLESCIVLNEAGELDKTTRINVPCSTLSTLSISLIDSQRLWRNAEDPTFVHYRSMFEHLKIKRTAFVRLTTSNSWIPVQHLMLQKGEAPMTITREELMEYSKGRHIYDIECKSLSSLEFNMKSFKMKLQFKDGKLENGCKSKIRAMEEHGAEFKSIAPDMFVAKVRHDFEELKKDHISFEKARLEQQEALVESDTEEEVDY